MVAHTKAVHHLTLQNIRAIHLSRDTEPLAGIRDSLSVWHEMQLLVLLAHIVECRSKEIECRIDAELVEEGILAIVSLAHLDRIIAHSATDAEEAGANHHRRNEKTAAYQQQMHIVLRQQEKPLEIAAQTDERIDKCPREHEIEGDIEPVGRLLQEHARCSGHIAEPPEDAGVDVLEKILEIRGIGCRRHEGDGKPCRIPDVDATQQTAMTPPQAGSNKEHSHRQYRNITSDDIVKPYTLDKRHHPTRPCIYYHAMQGYEFYQSEKSHHQQCQYMHRKEIPQSLKISFHLYSTLEIGCKVNNYIPIKAKIPTLFYL